MWALTLDFTNYAGDSVYYYWPLFQSMEECLWWQDFIWQRLEDNGAHDLKWTACTKMRGAS